MLATTTVFIAPDIECGGCAAAIRRALEKSDGGVSDVAVDVDKKTVMVKHEAAVGEIAKILGRAGFPSTVKG
jgi:copper chaperone CopZ